MDISVAANQRVNNCLDGWLSAYFMISYRFDKLFSIVWISETLDAAVIERLHSQQRVHNSKVEGR